MTTANIYLTFNGNCEEAINFYKTSFDGEIESFMRFSEMPVQEGMPPLPEELLNNVTHVTLAISPTSKIMASDRAPNWGPDYKPGNNFAIMLNLDSKEEVDKILASLSEGGEVTMAPANTFWGSYFGSLTDRFGIQWMLSFALEQES